MNRNEYKLLVEKWKKYLIKESDSLDINNQINRAENIVKEKLLNSGSTQDAKLKITINKEDKNEYRLVARIENDEGTHLGLIAKIFFSKLPNNSVFDLDGIERGCYIISNTEYVKRDLGPLMYDVIIEFVSSDNSVLCSDRYDITSEAQNLWKNYLHNREDVFAAQLDIDNDMLDPETYPNLTSDYWKDDLRQDVAIEDKKEKWYESAFSKGYYKKDTFVIDKLNTSNLFKIDIQEL